MKKEKRHIRSSPTGKIRTPSEAYFKTLVQKVSVEERHSAIKIDDSSNYWFCASGCSCSIYGILFLFNDFSKPTKELKGEKDLSMMNDEEIYAYVNEHIDDFTIDELSIPLSDETIEEDFYLTDISQDEIISYIEAENIDPDEFEDELLILKSIVMKHVLVSIILLGSLTAFAQQPSKNKKSKKEKIEQRKNCIF